MSIRFFGGAFACAGLILAGVSAKAIFILVTVMLVVAVILSDPLSDDWDSE